MQQVTVAGDLLPEGKWHLSATRLIVQIGLLLGAARGHLSSGEGMGEVVQSPSLEVSKDQMNKALSSLV